MHRRICQGPVWLLASLLAMATPILAQQTAAPAESVQPAQPPAASPPQGQIDATGFIKTADGSPVPGATLRATNTDTRQVWVSWTDLTGKFEFPTLPRGHYTIEATQLGFVSSSIQAQFSEPPPQPPPFSSPSAWPHSRSSPLPPNRTGRSMPGENARTAAHPALDKTPQTAGPAASALPAARGGQGGGRRGGQLPQGLLNAMQQGLAGGGFQQTDVTGASEAGDEGVGEANAPVPPAAGGSSDSFLLQGTVGQGLSYNAGGFPGGGFRGPGGPWRPRCSRRRRGRARRRSRDKCSVPEAAPVARADEAVVAPAVPVALRAAVGAAPS